jgi:hypothetical protein
LFTFVIAALFPRLLAIPAKPGIRTNLLEFTQYISNGLDNGEQIDVIYTDLSKAFDVVNHGLLLQKLSGFGFCNDIVITQIWPVFRQNPNI